MANAAWAVFESDSNAKGRCRVARKRRRASAGAIGSRRRCGGPLGDRLHGRIDEVGGRPLRPSARVGSAPRPVVIASRIGEWAERALGRATSSAASCPRGHDRDLDIGGLAKRILGAGRRRHPGIVDPLDDAPVEGLWPLASGL